MLKHVVYFIVFVVVVLMATSFIAAQVKDSKDTSWRLGCTSTGMSHSDCVALQEKQQ